MPLQIVHNYQTFTDTAPVEERVSVLAPVINQLLEQHDSGESEIGAESFSEDIICRIDAAGLLEKGRWVKVQHVAAHVDNREGAMLVPVDVHELLYYIVTNAGWSEVKWNALACEIPNNETGQSWRLANVELADQSDGLLPRCNPDMLQIVTGRGSHGTAAVRCMEFAAKGIHAELCSEDGRISKSKIIERQPSMKEPLTKGCRYDVIKSDLVEACPRLMEILSRTGNSGNNVFREQTALQQCNRLHALAAAYQKVGRVIEWDKITKQCCIGIGTHFSASAKKLVTFVKKWSGGQDGHCLRELEAFEKTLKVKRKLYPHDLEALGKVDFASGPKYVPALVKAMLTSPDADSTGHCVLFSAADFSTIQPKGKFRKIAQEVCAWLENAEKFIVAYGQFNSLDRMKILSDMEVRSVMFVHHKKAPTRISYQSLIHIVEAMYNDAKGIDPKLPSWPKLTALKIKAGVSKLNDASAELREICDGAGMVADNDMMARGFKVGSEVTKNDDDSVYVITILNQCLANCTMRPKTGAKAIVVTRLEMIDEWSVHCADVVISWPGDVDAALTHYESQCDIWKGCIKLALAEKFRQISADEHVRIFAKPETKVCAMKDFKVGALKLVAFTNDVRSSRIESKNGFSVGTCFHDGVGNEGLGNPVRATVKHQLTFPPNPLARTHFGQPTQQFMVAFWACKSTSEVEGWNCEVQFLEVTIKCIASRTVKVPVLINTKHIHDGDELIMLKQSTELEDEAEPQAKRQRVATEPKPGDKSKGKGKGRGRGKGKGRKT